MNRLVLTFAGLFLALAVVTAQTPSVKMRLKESSGLFGIGGPRTVTIDLTTANKDKQLNDVNANEGQYYYFYVKPVENWSIDEDFVKEDLAKLTIVQGGTKLQIMTKGELPKVKGEGILVGFEKTLRLHQPFTFTYTGGKTPVTAEFAVPLELWPGYSSFTKMMADADVLTRQRRFREAIWALQNVIANQSFKIIPDYASVPARRTLTFDMYTGARYQEYLDILTSGIYSLRQKITNLDQLRPEVQFAVDSIPNPSLSITGFDTAEKSVIDKARTIILQIGVSRDSLQRLLDDENTKWINEGSATGKNGQFYKTVIEVLAYAFSSLDFFDTTATQMNVSIEPEQRALLEKYNLVESYETFIKLSADRFARRLSIFQLTFLTNLQKDTAAFSLPFYSMLKAVNDYYLKNFASSKREIKHIFQTSYIPELNERFDMMRIAIQMRESGFPAEAMRLVNDAKAAEGRGDFQVAQERYMQATTLAPNFAFASYALGKFFGRTGDAIRGYTFLQSAFRVDTLFLSAYREAVKLYRPGGNWAPIVDVLLLALQYGNDYWEINHYLGEAYMGLADPQRAIIYFERALQLNPASYSTNIQAGLTYQAMRDYGKARDYFNRAVSLDPARMEAVDYLQKLNEEQRKMR